MNLSQFRTMVALLSQRQLAKISKVSTSTIQQIENGKSFSQLSKGKILTGLSKQLGRRVEASEIEEFSTD